LICHCYWKTSWWLNPNPIEKYYGSQIGSSSSPRFWGENQQMFVKPPARLYCCQSQNNHDNPYIDIEVCVFFLEGVGTSKSSTKPAEAEIQLRSWEKTACSNIFQATVYAPRKKLANQIVYLWIRTASWSQNGIKMGGSSSRTFEANKNNMFESTWHQLFTQVCVG